MNPVFIQIGDFSIAWYGVLITLGIVLGTYIAQLVAKKRGLDVNLLSDMVFWAVIWGVIGARVLFVATSPHLFQNPDVWGRLYDMINIRQGGLSIHGGLIFGIAALLYYQWRYNINFYAYAETLAPGLGLGIIGGRLGNIMNGSDTVGRVTGLPVGFVWPESAKGFHNAMCNPNNAENLVQYCQNGIVTAPVHFTQLYGVFIGIALVALGFYWLRQNKTHGYVFWQVILWYSILRSVVEETFRLNPLTWNVYLSEGLGQVGIGLFTLTQLVSIPLVIISVVMLYRLKGKN